MYSSKSVGSVESLRQSQSIKTTKALSADYYMVEKLEVEMQGATTSGWNTDVHSEKIEEEMVIGKNLFIFRSPQHEYMHGFTK